MFERERAYVCEFVYIMRVYAYTGVCVCLNAGAHAGASCPRCALWAGEFEPCAILKVTLPMDAHHASAPGLSTGMLGFVHSAPPWACLCSALPWACMCGAPQWACMCSAPQWACMCSAQPWACANLSCIHGAATAHEEGSGLHEPSNPEELFVCVVRRRPKVGSLTDLQGVRGEGVRGQGVSGQGVRGEGVRGQECGQGVRGQVHGQGTGRCTGRVCRGRVCVGRGSGQGEHVSAPGQPANSPTHKTSVSTARHQYCQTKASIQCLDKSADPAPSTPQCMHQAPLNALSTGSE